MIGKVLAVALLVGLAGVALANPVDNEEITGKPFSVRSLLCTPSYGRPCPKQHYNPYPYPYGYPHPYFYPYRPQPPVHKPPVPPHRPFVPRPKPRGGFKGSGSGSSSSGGKRFKGSGSGSSSSGGRRHYKGSGSD